ncbi:MAG: ubiquitin carboxyl-terminal hydrolase [Oscillospiraceae bacterium]|jgi:uncharacterized UBP type Zn finger protein|nr:ubiquitin carboxyl-terminal hydrolase [Oscillospiraceae bacterium]
MSSENKNKKFLSALLAIGSIFSFEYSNLLQALKKEEPIKQNLSSVILNNNAQKSKIGSFEKENNYKKEQKKSITSICELFLKKHKFKILNGVAVLIPLSTLMWKFKNKKPTSNSNETTVPKYPSSNSNETIVPKYPSDNNKPTIFTPKSSLSEKGLPNFGQICYLNATLQMLFHISEFSDAVIKYNGKSLKKDCALHQLKNIFKKLKFEQEVEIKEMKDFHDCISKSMRFRTIGGEVFDNQQDIFDFILMLLDFIEERIPEIYGIYDLCIKNIIRYPELEQAFPDWNWRIEKVFSLAVEGKNEMLNCIDEYFAKKEISDYELPDGSKTKAIIETYIKSLSKHIFFQMNRYKYTSSGTQKLTHEINFNAKEIDFEKYFIQESFFSVTTPQVYKVVGAICHQGDANCGHYYYVHVLKDGKGILFNDSEVKEISCDDTLSYINNAYLLELEKCT